MARKLNKEELIALTRKLMNPVGLSTKQVDKMFDEYALNCPDPVGAIDLFVNDLEYKTAEDLIAKAYALPPRALKDVPFSELGPNDPLRKVKLDS